MAFSDVVVDSIVVEKTREMADYNNNNIDTENNNNENKEMANAGKTTTIII